MFINFIDSERTISVEIQSWQCRNNKIQRREVYRSSQIIVKVSVGSIAKVTDPIVEIINELITRKDNGTSR